MSDTAFTQLLDLAVGTVVVASFAALWSRRLVGVIRILAVQGVALAAVALLIGIHESEPELVAVAMMVLLLRGFILPALIMRALHATTTRVEVESLINVPSSLLAASVMTLVAYAVSRDLVALADTPHTQAMPLGIAVALIGILMLVTRRKASGYVATSRAARFRLALLRSACRSELCPVRRSRALCPAARRAIPPIA